MILGITGSIGCGKSTVLKMFESAGWSTVGADDFCRRLYDNPDGEFAAACRREWDGAFFTNGKFDRTKIAAVVFRDPVALKRLTGLIYPLLERELDGFAADCRERGLNAAAEVPLLYESGMEKFFDAVLTVWAPSELRRQRLRELRGFDDGEISRREALQMNPDEKLERADYALLNQGDISGLRRQFDIFLQQITQRKG